MSQGASSVEIELVRRVAVIEKAISVIPRIEIPNVQTQGTTPVTLVQPTAGVVALAPGTVVVSQGGTVQPAGPFYVAGPVVTGGPLTTSGAITSASYVRGAYVEGYNTNTDNRLVLWTDTAGTNLLASVNMAFDTWRPLRLGASKIILDNDIETEAWTLGTLLNSWAHIGAPYTVPAFYKDRFGVVHLKGLPIHANPITGIGIFVLPPGYRPPEEIVVAVPSSSAFGEVRISTGGNITVIVGSNWVSLDGITFRV